MVEKFLALIKIRPTTPIFVLLIIGLVAALFLASNYGMAWDDQGLWDYADHTLQIYQEALRGKLVDDPGPGNLRYYGPAFLTLERMGENALVALFPQLSRLTIWHFAIFATFLIGVASLYSIVAKLFSSSVALGTTLLFALQPLIWGHAFINGKDTPFLTFFLLSIALGIKIEEVIPESAKGNTKQKTLVRTLHESWGGLNTSMRRRIAWLFAVLVLLTLGVIFIPIWAESWIQSLIQFAATHPEKPLGLIFQSLAGNAANLPLENYVQKALNLIQLAGLITLVLCWILLLAYAVRKSPSTGKWIGKFFAAIPFRSTGAHWKSPIIWWAGFALALATATRVVAPFAGLLVAFYLLRKRGSAVIPTFIPYAVIAAIGTYLLWPYLWHAPVSRFWQSFSVMSNFPQPGITLFNGQIISVSELPFYYLPELVLIQFTVPALLLILFGFWIYLKTGLPTKQGGLVPVLLLWIGLPVVYAMVFTPNMYDNFRQWLFIIPPLFIVGGFSLDWLAKTIKTAMGYWAVVASACMFGLIPIIQLHPYEYIYYNALVGGVRDAKGQFELDYWATALTESTVQLNSIAPQHSRVVVWGQELIVRQAARADLLVEGNRGGSYDPLTGYDYAVINLSPTRDTETLYPEASIVVSVARVGVPLAVVKQIHPEVGRNE